MRKTVFLTFLLTILSGSILFSNAQSLPFKGGEKLTVVVHYKLGFSADIAEFTLSANYVEKDIVPYYHIVLNASTYKGYDTFYKVRDLYEAKFSASDLSPIYFHRDVHEGKYWAKTYYDWRDNGKTLHAVVDKRNRPHRDTLYHYDQGVRDIVNLVYYVRSLDMKALQKSDKNFLMGMDKDILNVRFHYCGKEVKKVSGLGTFNTVKISIAMYPVTKGAEEELSANADATLINIDMKKSGKSADSPDFYGDDKVFVWLTDDSNRLPVYFSVDALVGSLNGRISEYSGLKYPVTSKIK